MEVGSISAETDRCLQLLNTLWRGRQLEADMRAWLEDAELKVNLFVSRLGILAAGSHSIDHRLRRNKTVSSAILQILDAAVLDTRDRA